MAYIDFPIVNAGGGYASTSSSYLTAQGLTTYTTTSAYYAGYLKSGITWYNMQTQIYCDLSAGLPAGAIFDTAWFYIDINSHPSTTSTIVMKIYQDAWGAPGGWTAADMETTASLDNNSPLAWASFQAGTNYSAINGGLKTFSAYTAGKDRVELLLGTATELEATVTASYWGDSYGSSDPGTLANYFKLESAAGGAGYIRVYYTLPHNHAQMVGCNI